MNCIIPPPPPTEKEQEKILQRNIRHNNRFINYVGRLTAISLRENAGFGAVRFDRFNNGAADLGRVYIDDYGPADKDATEYAVDSYYVIARDCRAFGWDPEVELWRDEVFDTLLPRTGYLTRSQREQRDDRLAYAKAISFYTREMLCMNAMELHETNGLGREKLNRIIHPIRDRYLNLMRLYLTQDDAGYMKELRDVLDAFNALGFYKEETEL